MAGGVAVGGGIAGIIAVVMFLMGGGDPSQLVGALNGETVGGQQANDLSQECQTGADAASRDAGRLNITVTYTVRSTKDSRSLVYPFYLIAPEE